LGNRDKKKKEKKKKKKERQKERYSHCMLVKNVYGAQPVKSTVLSTDS
jgi:hypothetical protein